MTTTKKDGPVTVTILESGLTILHDDWAGRVAYRGEVIHYSAEEVAKMREAADGRSPWFEQSEERQIERWGRVKFRIGDHSEGIEVGDDDLNGVVYRRWQAAVSHAEKISDPADRAAAFRDVKKKFPEQYGSPQRTLREY